MNIGVNRNNYNGLVEMMCVLAIREKDYEFFNSFIYDNLYRHFIDDKMQDRIKEFLKNGE